MSSLFPGYRFQILIFQVVWFFLNLKTEKKIANFSHSAASDQIAYPSRLGGSSSHSPALHWISSKTKVF